MAINIIPEKLINAKVYDGDGNTLVAMADVDLPDIEYLSETLSGSGLAGEYDSPTMGHIKAMKVKFKFRAVYSTDLTMIAPTPRLFDIRASIQGVDAASGEYVPYAYRVVMQAMPLKAGGGKMDPGKKMDNELEMSVSYIKIYVDNEPQVEIDVLNFICIIGGVDFLAVIREHLGMSS
jgi:uncharacterized protein